MGLIGPNPGFAMPTLSQAWALKSGPLHKYDGLGLSGTKADARPGPNLFYTWLGMNLTKKVKKNK